MVYCPLSRNSPPLLWIFPPTILLWISQDYFRMLVGYSYWILTLITFYYEIFSWYAAVKQDPDSSIWAQIATGWNLFDTLVFMANMLMLGMYAFLWLGNSYEIRDAQAPFHSWEPGHVSQRFYVVSCE